MQATKITEKKSWKKEEKILKNAIFLLYMRIQIPKELLYPAPFYNFLNYISECEITGPILDCGSGGPRPKQSLFVLLGFDIVGIEISEERKEEAQRFAKEHKLELIMQKDDMRSMPFESNHFGYVYSWNTIFHLNKKDIKKAIKEMIRVLKPGGLCFVNFLSVDAEYFGRGEEQNSGEFLQIEGEEKVIHTFFTDEESDGFFEEVDIDIVYKEKRISYMKLEERVMKDSYIDYIVQKNRN
jgi:SAM-dependent methyltransferase